MSTPPVPYLDAATKQRNKAYARQNTKVRAGYVESRKIQINANGTLNRTRPASLVTLIDKKNNVDNGNSLCIYPAQAFSNRRMMMISPT